MNQLFTIHPYVDITITPQGALLYNTLTYDCFVIRKKENIELLSCLEKTKPNSGVIELTDIKKAINNDFLQFLKENYLGTCFHLEQSTQNPIQVFPQLKIKTEIELYDNVYEFSIGEKVLSYLDELTIYLTNATKVKSIFANAHKQFTYPIDKKDIYTTELHINTLKSIFNQIENSNLSNINFLGGNIFMYSNFFILLEALNNVPFNLTFHFFIEDLITTETSNLKALKNINPQIVVYISRLNDDCSIKKIISLLTSFQFDFILVAIVQNEEDITFINSVNDFEFRLTPYFSGTNLDFFSKYVFLTEDDLHFVELTQLEVLTNTKINNNNFGKILILNNGDVYSNFNHPTLGSIYKENIKKLIVSELRGGTSWLNIRIKVEPCKYCLYNKICPPMSNYEQAIGKNNLCEIKI